MDMNKYYEYRKKIRALYDREPSSRNDLGCSIMEVREKNKCVISVSIQLNNYYIEATCDEGTSVEKVNNIADIIVRRIGYFLSNNINSIPDLTPEEKIELEFMISGIGSTYCDYIVIGNVIKINL